MQRNFCGYTGFSVDVTPLLNYGGVNSVAVRVDAEEQEGWWYEGAGIYRHTWLVKRAPVHVATDGVFANPVRQPDGKWLLPVEVTVESSLKEAATAEVEVTLKDPVGDGKPASPPGARMFRPSTKPRPGSPLPSPRRNFGRWKTLVSMPWRP